MALPASLPATALEERVTLNLFIDSATPLASSSAAKHAAAAAAASEEASCLRAELEALRAQAAAEQAAEAQQAAAAVEDQQAGALAAAAVDPSAGVNLVIHVADLPAAVEQQPALAEPVQLVLNIVEPPLHSPGDAGTSISSATPAAGAAAPHLQQQLARAEACREELARQAGQLKGRIAKLEGAALAGESRVKAQATELEGLKAANRELKAALEAAQAQVGVTPERARAERQRLVAAASEAQAVADAHAERARRLEAVLSFEDRERRELAEFTALEHGILTEAQRGAAGEAAQWRADAHAAAAQLADARGRLVETDAALLQRDEEVRQLRAELEAAQAATEAAAQLAGEWRQRADQFDRDRQAAAANIRKAERELELVAQDNERMFRQLNFVRTRLVGQLAGLDLSVPDIGKLARELQSWCDREAAQRARPRP
ncbi:hypothetical protein ABPG77_005655 [Micractinium sp. CCAP 211/92]